MMRPLPIAAPALKFKFKKKVKTNFMTDLHQSPHHLLRNVRSDKLVGMPSEAKSDAYRVPVLSQLTLLLFLPRRLLQPDSVHAPTGRRGHIYTMHRGTKGLIRCLGWVDERYTGLGEFLDIGRWEEGLPAFDAAHPPVCVCLFDNFNDVTCGEGEIFRILSKKAGVVKAPCHMIWQKWR